MNRQSLLSWTLAVGTAATLSGCYVVPIDARYPYDPAHPYVAQPAQVALPAPQPLPVTLQARLYPANDVAGRIGALSATVVDTLNGHATFYVNFEGETMQGEATRVTNDASGFGRVHRQVYGDGRMPEGRRGIANAAGAHGGYVNCEYALTAATMGTGACVFSNGAMYQLHFGA
jgi:hypothetical protein